MTAPDDIMVNVTVPDGRSVIVTSDGNSHLVAVDETGRRHVQVKAALRPPPKSECGPGIAATNLDLLHQLGG